MYMYDPVNFECWINDNTRMGSLLPKGNKAPGERITTARTVWRGREGGREGGGDPEEDGKRHGRTITMKKKWTLFFRPSHTISVFSVYNMRAVLKCDELVINIYMPLLKYPPPTTPALHCYNGTSLARCCGQSGLCFRFLFILLFFLSELSSTSNLQ